MKAIYNENAEDLYQNAPCGYLSMLADGGIVNINKTLLTWLKLNREEVINIKSFQDLLGIGGKIYYETHLMPLFLMQGEVKEINIELRGKDKSVVPVLINGTKVLIGHDQALYRLSITDISQRKMYEKELLTARKETEDTNKRLMKTNEELEQFAYVASHDLQEPLRMITNFLTQLERKYKNKLDERANRYIYFAVDGAVRMRQIILDLLAYSRAGKGGEDQREIVNLNDIIDDYLRLRRKLIQEKSAKIEVEDLPSIHNLKTPLNQIFSNLIDNALKYSKTDIKPEIVVSAKEEEMSYVFSVKDNGIGIDENEYDKIFIIFQRLHDKSVYSGTGMGLAIVKKIIDNLGGQIWLDSKEGIGTTFYFRINK